MKLQYTTSNSIRGAFIYSAGDTIAALMLNEFSMYRLIGMILVGATIYAFEIPNYFNWIEQKTARLKGTALTLTKTTFAILYFNPLWIARHLICIKIFSGNYEQINVHLLQVAGWSFLVNIPISAIANFFIQNKISLKWRFFASAIFSALMAIYYALSETIFK